MPADRQRPPQPLALAAALPVGWLLPGIGAALLLAGTLLMAAVRHRPGGRA